MIITKKGVAELVKFATPFLVMKVEVKECEFKNTNKLGTAAWFYCGGYDTPSACKQSNNISGMQVIEAVISGLSRFCSSHSYLAYLCVFELHYSRLI